LNDGSFLHRFLRAYRDFGFVIATRVAYSKIRGMLRPASALPAPPIYNAMPREVSFLLNTAEQSAATIGAVVEVIARRGGLDWDVCICERSPVAPKMAHALAHLRGTQPWIRVVTADKSVDDAMAARWTVEQTTGEFVALVAPGYTPEAEAISRLLARLHDDPDIDAAVLLGTDSDCDRPPAGWNDCRMLLQRKSGYLAALPVRWLLTAPALSKELYEAGVPITYMPVRERAGLD
jgi:hypothetical protein